MSWEIPAERPGYPAPEDVQARRRGLLAAPEPILAPGIARADTVIGGVPAVVLEPERATRASLIHFHGGGYRSGAPLVSARFASAVAAASSVRVVLPRYRLAPEHPFPAALRDGCAVYDTLAAQGLPVFVGGDSAGAGLAVEVLLALTRLGRRRATGSVLLSPWVDLTVSADSYTINEDSDQLFDAESAAIAGDFYLQGLEPNDPLASPVFSSLAGLPPVLLFVSSQEVLLDDSLTLARRLAVGQVPVELHVVTGVQHIFPVLAPELPESVAALKSVARFLESAISTA